MNKIEAPSERAADAASLESLHRESVRLLTAFFREKNIKPAQDIGGVTVRAVEAADNTASCFWPPTNTVHVNNALQKSAPYILVHELAHAASYSGFPMQGRYRVGFKALEKPQVINRPSETTHSGNTWLDEACATIIESIAYTPSHLRPNDDPYIAGYTFLAHELMVRLGIDEIFLLRAFVGQERYREELDAMVYETWGGSIDDLDPLFIGFNDECRAQMAAVLRDERVTIRMPRKIIDSDPRWKKLRTMFPNMNIETTPETPALKYSHLYADKARLDHVIDREEPTVKEIFLEQFAAHLPAVLHKKLTLQNGSEVYLQTLIDTHLARIQSAHGSVSNIIDAQKNFIRDLVSTLSQLPVKNWNISARQVVENGATNCSSAAAVLQMVIESTASVTGLRMVRYVNPPGHAFNMVHFPDGSIFYADPRNAVFEDITNNVVVTHRPNLIIYTIRRPDYRFPFRYITSSSHSKIDMVRAYLGNLIEVPDVMNGVFPKEFDDETDDELIAMRREVRPLAELSAITPEHIDGTRALHDRLNATRNNFYTDPDIQAEIAHFEVATNPESPARISALLINDPLLRADLRSRREQLRQFLLGDIEDIATPNDELTSLLTTFRQERTRAWTLVHRTRTEREHEVDELLGRL